MADVTCGGCGNAVPGRLVVCPACAGLVHRARLESIAAEAAQATAVQDYEREGRLWRDALPLLPQGSTQYDTVVARINAANASNKSAAKNGRRTGALASAGAGGIALLTKGKFLLAGLTKLSTVISMLAFLGIYWKAWGFAFAAAMVAAIYIHEMGHVAAMKSRGLAFSAPMFIPGFGAFVAMKDVPCTPEEDARIGLAGPLWGLGAAIAAMAAFVATHSPFWRAVAHTTAVLNLFNLMPVWQLDGSRGFAALTRAQRWIALAIIVTAWVLTHEGMLVLVALVALWRAIEKQYPPRPDWGALAQYGLLIGALSALTMLRQ